MAVYYFTLSILAISGCFLTGNRKNSRNTARYLCAAFLLLTLVSSCRYAIGFDYFSYRNIYEMVSQWSFGDILHIYGGEPLYFILCKLFTMAGFTYQLFLLAVNMFLMYVAMRFIYRYSKLPWVSACLYVMLQFLAFNMNLIRQSIAAAFFLLAYPYLKEQKPLPFAALLLTGGLFHNSLFFVFPLYFLLPKKLGKKALLSLCALTITVYLFFEPLFTLVRPFLPARYSAYQGSYFWQANGFLYVLLPALYCLLVLLFHNRITDPFLRSLSMNSALCHCIISLFITRHFILERFAIYPFVFSLIAIPEIICSFQGEKRHGRKPFLTYRRVLLLFLLLGCAYFAFAVLTGSHRVYPYIGLWDKSVSLPD